MPYVHVKVRYLVVLVLAALFLYTFASSLVRWMEGKIGQTYSLHHLNSVLYPSVTFCPAISEHQGNQNSFHKNLSMYNYSKASLIEEYVQRFDHLIEFYNG